MSNWSAPKVLLVGIGVFVSLAGCGAATDDRPIRWSFISPAIIQPSCATANCHSDIAKRVNVDLSTPAVGYRTLLQRHFVIPGDPVTSSVVYLMRARGARRMPPDFALPLEDIELIERWIAAGALNN